MKTIAVIPARGGSKRLPGKNLMPLAGIPLIAHSIRYALENADLIDEVFVSTDDAQIRNVALEYGAKVIDRPAELSGDLEPTATAVRHVLENCGYDATVVLLQPTNPLRPENLLRDCLKTYIEKNADSLFTVSRNHHKLGKVENGKFLPFNYEPGQRSQDLEPLFFENGLLYISSPDLIRECTIISKNALPFIVEHRFASVDIDTEADFAYASYLTSHF